MAAPGSGPDDDPIDCLSVRLRIEGRVQGVGFRAFVEREAKRRHLDGFVRNRRDGGVEAVLSGARAAVEPCIEACRRGPAGARVDFCKVVDESAAVARGFVVAPTA